MARNRFIPGDIIRVERYFDLGDDRYKSGIIQITGYDPDADHTTYGTYDLTVLEGDIEWIRINAKLFDQEECIVWLGNINEDRALRLLYGR